VRLAPSSSSSALAPKGFPHDELAEKRDLLVDIYMNRALKQGLGALNEFERPLCLIPPFSLDMTADGFAWREVEPA
jgi:hypothetical protein